VIAAGILASAGAFSRLRPYRFGLTLLAAGYLLNFLPFSRIVRVMFLYHYFFALIYSLAFATLILGALADWMQDHPQPWKFPSLASRNFYIGILGLALVGFLYFAPLSYGLPLSPNQLQSHIWIPSWR
jgi:dolichyl-phosphate-mannose-protein mannosyltransferase